MADINSLYHFLIPNNLLIHITPRPLLTILCRDGNGVIGFPCMLRGMLIGRRVATQGGTTGLARAQVHPIIACFNALFALVRFLQFQLLLARNKV
jgi:hypothetical protein